VEVKTVSKLSSLFLKKASKLVAIVVPLSNRLELTAEEQISLQHLTHYLGKYDKYLVAPKRLKVNIAGFGIKRFGKKFFGSAAAHSKLLLSPEFYEAFSDYKFILVYHLDALALSDQLTKWCEMDFDFIGAPWIKHEDAPYAGNPVYEGKVGNGGFSLRKIESFLKVIYSLRYYSDPSEYGDDFCTSKSWDLKYIKFYRKIAYMLKLRNSAIWEISRYKRNEESFWADKAAHYYPPFRIPPVEIALDFAFECVPRYCFEKNNYNLPFGCHAWHYYDREFWEPYLLK